MNLNMHFQVIGIIYVILEIQNPNEGFLIKYELEDIRQKSVVLLNFKCSDEEWEAFPVKESREAGIVYYTAKILTSAGKI